MRLTGAFLPRWNISQLQPAVSLCIFALCQSGFRILSFYRIYWNAEGKKRTRDAASPPVDKIFYFHDYFAVSPNPTQPPPSFWARRQRLACMSRECSPAGACSIENCIYPKAPGIFLQTIMVILETAVLSLPQLGRLSDCKY